MSICDVTNRLSEMALQVFEQTDSFDGAPSLLLLTVRVYNYQTAF